MAIEVETREVVGSLSSLIPSFRRTLRSQNKRPRTVLCYVDAANRLNAFLKAKGMPQILANIRREHVESFMEDQLARFKPAPPPANYKALQQLFRWALEEGVAELASSGPELRRYHEKVVAVMKSADKRSALAALRPDE